MTGFLYSIVSWVAQIHSRIMSINDSRQYGFTDKELHFIVIGIIGMALVFAIHPIFNSLAKNDHVMAITWIYVFTLMLVLTFAIEIGQGFTDTGVMEFTDIVFGIVGFLAMFAVFAVIRAAVKAIARKIRKNP